MNRLASIRALLTAAAIAPLAGPLVAAPQSAPVAPAVHPAEGEQGMVIRGDQEAPLVLYIVPWQEPGAHALPEAPLPPLLPKVLDRERSLIDDPANRSPESNDGARDK